MKIFDRLNNYINENNFKITIGINYVNVVNYTLVLDFNSNLVSIKYNNGIVDEIGFVKKSLYEFYKRKGYKNRR